MNISISIFKEESLTSIQVETERARTRSKVLSFQRLVPFTRYEVQSALWAEGIEWPRWELEISIVSKEFIFFFYRRMRFMAVWDSNFRWSRISLGTQSRGLSYRQFGVFKFRFREPGDRWWSCIWSSVWVLGFLWVRSSCSACIRIGGLWVGYFLKYRRRFTSSGGPSLPLALQL